jgi:hypothetical protein
VLHPGNYPRLPGILNRTEKIARDKHSSLFCCGNEGCIETTKIDSIEHHMSMMRCRPAKKDAFLLKMTDLFMYKNDLS